MVLNEIEWQGEDVIVAIATGTRIPARTFHWLTSLAKLTDRQLVMVEYKQDAQGFNGEFNLHTIGPEAFKLAMVTYFAQKGFSASPTQSVERIIEWAPL